MRSIILTLGILLTGIFSFAYGESSHGQSDNGNLSSSNQSGNLEQYKSFDFELISKENPILEKQLTTLLKDKLEQKGLKRDTKNPELLIFIYFYSGDDKLYVPPVSPVKTRYGNEYNIWTGGNSKAIISSRLSNSKKQTSYRCSIKVRMLDARKVRAMATVPPIIFQSENERVSGEKTDLLNIAPSVFDGMLNRPSIHHRYMYW